MGTPEDHLVSEGNASTSDTLFTEQDLDWVKFHVNCRFLLAGMKMTRDS